MNWAPNLIALQVNPGAPWDAEGLKIPEHVRADKTARHSWITNPNTKHHVYSLWEGLNSRQRISKKSGAAEGNPPFVLHGLAVDYDYPQTLEKVDAAASAAHWKPNWLEHTISGNWRVLWMFERPIAVPPNYQAAQKFASFLAQKLGAKALIPAMDEQALDPSRRFTNGDEWYQVTDDAGKPMPALPAEVLKGWFIEISPKLTFASAKDEPAIPLDVVAEKLKAKYPKFAEWPGEFEAESQGPTFWAEGSTSPRSAIVKEHGIFSFAQHSAKPFMSWADLLGRDVVKELSARRSSSLTDGIFWDKGEHYYMTRPSGDWTAFSRDQIVLHLKVDRGVSTKRDKEGNSEIEGIMNYLHMHQAADQVGSFVGHPAGFIQLGDTHVLNLYQGKPPQPHAEPQEWGTNFLFIADKIDGMFSPEERDVLLSWLHIAYKGYLKQEPVPGQALIISGPPNLGKTFLNRVIIGGLLGSWADASCMLRGVDSFGGEMFKAALWCSDDSEMDTDQASKRRFTSRLKAFVANPTHRLHEKFKMPSTVTWLGRVCMTLNDDSVSSKAFPDTDQATLGKIIALHATPRKDMLWFGQKENQRLVNEQMAAFARYVLDYGVSEKYAGNDRFGMMSYHNPEVLHNAQHSGSYGGFREVLQSWCVSWFTEHGDDMEWRGSSFDLHKAISEEQAALGAMRKYDVDLVNRALAAFEQRGNSRVSSIEGPEPEVRHWRIRRPEYLPSGPQHPKTSSRKDL